MSDLATRRARFDELYVVVKELNSKLPSLPKDGDPVAMALAVAKAEQSELIASFSADLDGPVAKEQAEIEKEYILALASKDATVEAVAEADKNIEAVNKKRLAHWQFTKRLNRDAGRKSGPSPIRVRASGSGQRRTYGPPVTA